MRVQTSSPDSPLKTVKVSLSAVQIALLNSTPVIAIPAAGAGTVIDVISCYGFYYYNSVAFSNTEIFLSFNIGFGLSDVYLLKSATFFGGSPDNIFVKLYDRDSLQGSDLLINSDLLIYSSADDTNSGDGTADIYITYQVIKL